MGWAKHWVRVPNCPLTIDFLAPKTSIIVEVKKSPCLCYNIKNCEQFHWNKLFGGMYGLAMMSISTQTTSKNIDKIETRIVYKSMQFWYKTKYIPFPWPPNFFPVPPILLDGWGRAAVKYLLYDFLRSRHETSFSNAKIEWVKNLRLSKFCGPIPTRISFSNVCR